MGSKTRRRRRSRARSKIMRTTAFVVLSTVECIVRQIHERIVVHFPPKSLESPLAYPFCTFDHTPFCQALRQRTDAEFV